MEEEIKTSEAYSDTIVFVDCPYCDDTNDFQGGRLEEIDVICDTCGKEFIATWDGVD